MMHHRLLCIGGQQFCVRAVTMWGRTVKCFAWKNAPTFDNTLGSPIKKSNFTAVLVKSWPRVRNLTLISCPAAQSAAAQSTPSPRRASTASQKNHLQMPFFFAVLRLVENYSSSHIVAEIHGGVSCCTISARLSSPFPPLTTRTLTSETFQSAFLLRVSL